jgi:hypothetical protein
MSGDVRWTLGVWVAESQCCDGTNTVQRRSMVDTIPYAALACYAQKKSKNKINQNLTCT